MSSSFTLPDAASLGDLRTYLGRAARIEDGSVRLIADSGVLAVYTAILYPLGLLDELPTVLGLRTFALTQPEHIDVVVPLRSFQERLRLLAEANDVEHADAADPTRATPIEVELPLEVHTVTWAAISPPRGGWVPLPDVSAELLHRAARQGIDEVAASVPTSSGGVHRPPRPFRGLGSADPGRRAPAGRRGLRRREPRLPRDRTGPAVRDGAVEPADDLQGGTCS
ncbi:hypothetical protein [Curtobacterium sp. MCJR17_043]|uniref:hypothetical protein n=1 Tax=Curtobacterium sp. MCJR17_043 TaxID=2175660 RepID=UPI0032E9063E